MDTHKIQYGKPKLDLDIAWRGVYFSPSVEAIKSQLRDKAKSELKKKLQQENISKMYEIFGSGKLKSEGQTKPKGHTKLLTHLSDKDSEELDGILDKPNLVKDPLKKSESGKLDGQAKKRVSCSSINQSVDIRFRSAKPSSVVSELNIIFQQNRPAHYFGIRKPKVFETTDEKDGKDNQKQIGQSELMINLLNKQKTESEAKEISRRSSSMFQRLSMQLTTIAVDELRDRLVSINKSKTGSMKHSASVHEEVLDILNKLAKESIIDKYHLLSLAGYKATEIPDVDDKMERSRIMELFVTKYYKMNHPLRLENPVIVHETEVENNIMKHCVLNSKVINKLMNKKTFYPYRLQLKMAEIDASLSVTHEDAASKAIDQPMPKILTKKTRTNSKLPHRTQDILREVCGDIKEFNGFYQPLFEYCLKNVKDFKDLEKETNPEKIKKYIQSLGYTLTIHRNHPGSIARTLTQQFIKAGEVNNLILNELINNADGWLDQILKSFLSKFPSIRLEAFVTVAVLFSKPIYVTAIQSHLFSEIIYDVLATLLRCFDLKSEDYEMHYSLIGVIFHNAPCQELIDCLIERAPYSFHVEIVSKWPRFLYFAMKYWESTHFNTSIIHFKRMIETLENHYLRESLSRKYLKQAILCISTRFNVPSTMFTSWPKQTTVYPE